MKIICMFHYSVWFGICGKVDVDGNVLAVVHANIDGDSAATDGLLYWLFIFFDEIAKDQYNGIESWWLM